MSDMKEEKQLRPQYARVVSTEILDGLKEFCDEFACIVVPSAASNTSQNENDSEREAESLSMIDSLKQLIYELSDNLNRSIVRIEELSSAINTLSESMEFCGSTVIRQLEIRMNELQSIFEEIDIMNELLMIIEDGFVNEYCQRYQEILDLCDENRLIQKQLKQDPIGTFKKHYKPKIKNELTAQKEKIKNIGINIQSSAKSIWSKLIDSNKSNDANMIIMNESEQYKDYNQYNEIEIERETLSDIDDDQMKAINDYEWIDLPILSDWNQLMHDAKQKNKEKQNEKSTNLHQITIKWLSKEDIDHEEDEISISVKRDHSIDLP